MHLSILHFVHAMELMPGAIYLNSMNLSKLGDDAISLMFQIVSEWRQTSSVEEKEYLSEILQNEAESVIFHKKEKLEKEVEEKTWEETVQEEEQTLKEIRTAECDKVPMYDLYEEMERKLQMLKSKKLSEDEESLT